DDDVQELRRRQPGVEVIVVEGAGHSVQGDRPVELARIIEGFLRR
ncbi:MAG: alpha/beta hydrolase, partial [Acidimicrobiia bacterium]